MSRSSSLSFFFFLRPLLFSFFPFAPSPIPSSFLITLSFRGRPRRLLVRSPDSSSFFVETKSMFNFRFFAGDGPLSALLLPSSDGEGDSDLIVRRLVVVFRLT